MSQNPGQDALVSGDFAETRDAADLNAPIEWRGLPEFRPVTRDVRLVLSFDTVEEREQLIAQLGITISKKTGATWSAWWPPRDREDLAALRFDFGAAEQGEPDRGLDEQAEPDELDGRPPSQPSPDEERPDDRDDPEPADAPETAATAPKPTRSQPWPEHIGHMIALTFDDVGTVVGARCSTCTVALPPPDAVVEAEP